VYYARDSPASGLLFGVVRHDYAQVTSTMFGHFRRYLFPIDVSRHRGAPETVDTLQSAELLLMLFIAPQSLLEIVETQRKSQYLFKEQI
jgi:hypothetical protein